jgi:hypothetical protein
MPCPVCQPHQENAVHRYRPQTAAPPSLSSPARDGAPPPSPGRGASARGHGGDGRPRPLFLPRRSSRGCEVQQPLLPRLANSPSSPLPGLVLRYWSADPSSRVGGAPQTAQRRSRSTRESSMPRPRTWPRLTKPSTQLWLPSSKRSPGPSRRSRRPSMPMPASRIWPTTSRIHTTRTKITLWTR